MSASPALTTRKTAGLLRASTGLLLLVLGLGLNGCIEEQPGNPQQDFQSLPTDVMVVRDTLQTNTTWLNTRRYLLEGPVVVPPGRTLSIQPGTVIFGDPATQGRLIVANGGRLEARGSEPFPITFTSPNPPGNRNPGDWGGLILLGDAPLNTLTGSDRLASDTTWSYGGANPNHSFGVLSYVRILYAGGDSPGQGERAALTLAGVGANAQLDHVEVAYSEGDGLQLRGGAPRLGYLVCVGNSEDDLDIRQGCRGSFQYGLLVRPDNVTLSGDADGFDIRNDERGGFAEPLTRPVVVNYSLLGPGFYNGDVRTHTGAGMRLAEGGSVGLFNTLLGGMPLGLKFEEGVSLNHTRIDSLFLEGTAISALDTLLSTSSLGYNLDSFVNNSPGNFLFDSRDSFRLADPDRLPDPYARLQPGAPLLQAARFNNPVLYDGFLQLEFYTGAMDAETDWTRNWVEWDPQAVVY